MPDLLTLQTVWKPVQSSSHQACYTSILALGSLPHLQGEIGHAVSSAMQRTGKRMQMLERVASDLKAHNKMLDAVASDLKTRNGVLTDNIYSYDDTSNLLV